MRSIVPLAGLMIALGGCAQLLGVDDVVFRGEDGGAPDAPFDAIADASDAGVTCDANTQLDPKNCGRCGHDCLGAACTYGACGALLVASGTYLASSLATDGVRVFYRDQTSVVGCSVNGCDAGEVLATAPSNIGGAIAAGPTAVYWNDGTAVRSCDKTGCALAKTVFDAAPSTIDGIGVSASHVYATGHGASTIALYQSGLDGSAFAQIESHVATLTGAVSPRAPSGVYWYEVAPTPTVFYCDGTCTSGATASKTVPYAPTGIAASDLAVFVATNGGIYRIGDALGSQPALFYQGFVTAIAYASGNVFFIEQTAPDRVGACSANETTCASPTWLYKSTTSSYPLVAITADDSAVYWIVRGAEQIMKVSP